jgi:2-phosphosulfolactate phosphatase
VSVVVDGFPSNGKSYFAHYAIVAIDVIRASTTAVTAAATGRRCFPVASLEEALQKRIESPDCLLAGEIAGVMPEGFDLNNSPAKLALRSDHARPLILLSSAGTKLMVQSGAVADTYVGCLRNYKAVAAHLAERYERIALLGASIRGEFREEDQLCCAWLAAELLNLGHEPETPETLALIDQWAGVPVDACTGGNSAAYLRRSGQLDDLHFILTHVNDVPQAFQLIQGELLPAVSLSEVIDPKQPVAAPGRIAA